MDPLPQHHRAGSGLTLLEVIAALVVMGGLLVLTVGFGLPLLREAQTDRLAGNLRDLGVELQQHHQTRGVFPDYHDIASRVEDQTPIEGVVPVEGGEVAIDHHVTGTGETHIRLASVTRLGQCVAVTVPPPSVTVPQATSDASGGSCSPTLAPEVP